MTFEGRDITQIAAMPLRELAALMEGVLQPGWAPARGTRGDEPLAPEQLLAARRLAGELCARLAPLSDLGLGYLSLDRQTGTLSGGELQRLRLANQLLAGLFGVVFVLDEPSAGLHPADTEALLGILRGLRDRGNTVFYVEHSLDVIREADWIVDIGPGAGASGGSIVYSGALDGLRDAPDSVTRRYLFDCPDSPRPTPREPRPRTQHVRLDGVVRNNIRGLSVEFPLGCLTAVTGVSGSGKTTLVNQALPDLLRASLASEVGEASAADESERGDPMLAVEAEATRGRATGPADRLKRIVQVSQAPIGRTSRSNVATYTGLFDRIRSLFAATEEAKRRRYSASRFSFNLPSGRCPTCKGEGTMEVELLFLPTVQAPCSTCGGKRYNAETLEIEFDGSSIADVLALSVTAAREKFAAHADVVQHLDALIDVGLGYVSLGQPAPELSGGEAQRVKLASELRRAQQGDTLYLLDEPTSGLHPADSDRLLGHLHDLVDLGNTVILVEHDMRVVAGADWVVDMGPGAGDEGGAIVAQGTPREVAGVAGSATSTYLQAAVDRLAASDA